MIRRLARRWADEYLTRANLLLVAEADACRTDCERYDTALIEAMRELREVQAELHELHGHAADLTDRLEEYERQARTALAASTRPGAAGMAQHPAWSPTRDEIDQEISNKRRWDGVGD